MSNEHIQTYVDLVEEGIYVVGFIEENDEPSFDNTYTWDQLFEGALEYVSVPSGPIVVDGINDGVQYMLSLVDSLRKAADDLEDKIRSRKVLIRDKLAEGCSVEDACVSFNKYMRGQYT